MSQFKEATEKTMTLVEEEPALVEAFVQWLYTGQYELPPEEDEDSEESGYLLETMQLLGFSDKYDIPKLKKQLVTKLMDRVRDDHTAWCPGTDAVRHIYSNTCANAGIRRMLIDWIVWLTRNIWAVWHDASGLLSVGEFSAELVVGLCKHKWSGEPEHPFEGKVAAVYCENWSSKSAMEDGVNAGNNSQKKQSKAKDVHGGS